MTDTSQAFLPFLRQVLSGTSLSSEDAGHAFEIMVSGTLDPAYAAGFIAALRMRGETIEEIIGGVNALRRNMIPVEAPHGAIDTCGTGGGRAGLCNVSTLTALTVASCGVPVAKHGNRASSSACGSADFLAEYGIPLELSPEAISTCLREVGIGFMFAPRHHPCIRHVMPIRRAFGVRTIFNLLGPPANPASVRRQLLGLPELRLLEPIARAMERLGSRKIWTVHGSDGMDELTLSGVSTIVEIDRGTLRRFEIVPEDIGLNRTSLISAPDAPRKQFDRHAIEALFDGEAGAYRDIVILNSAAALTVAEDGTNLRDNAQRAAAAIDSGAVRKTLSRLHDIATRSR